LKWYCAKRWTGQEEGDKLSAPINEILAQIIGSIDRAEAVQLTPGQIISLLVKQVEGSQALLTYQGKFLLAQLEAQVNPGQRIRCKVEGEREGRVLLKVLPDNGRTSGDSGSPAVIRLLQDLGLPLTEKNQQIVRALICQELPVTKENLQAVSQLARKTGASDADLDVLTFSYKQEIPVTVKNFELIKAAFKDPGFLSAPLSNLREQLSELVRQLPAGQELRTTGEKVIALIEKMILKQNEVPGKDQADPGHVQAKLADVPRLLGLSTGQAGYAALADMAEGLPSDLRPQFFAKVLTLLTGVRAGEPAEVKEAPFPGGATRPNEIKVSDVPPKATTAAKDAAVPKEALSAVPSRDAIQIKEGMTPGDVLQTKDSIPFKDAAQPKDIIAAKDPLPAKDILPTKDTLTFVKDLFRMLRRNDAESSAEDLQALLNKLQGLVKGESAPEKALQTTITTVQERLSTMETLQRPAGPGQEGIFLMQSMFETGEKKYPLEMLVKYRKEENGRAIDFSRCHLYVTLATEGLGTVQAAVQLSGRNLNCRFSTESEKARQAIEKWLPDLTAKLTQLDYNVMMLPSRVRADEPPPALAPFSDRGGFYQVDITV
jgi:hypothetical protein